MEEALVLVLYVHQLVSAGLTLQLQAVVVFVLQPLLVVQLMFALGETCIDVASLFFAVLSAPVLHVCCEVTVDVF